MHLRLRWFIAAAISIVATIEVLPMHCFVAAEPAFTMATLIEDGFLFMAAHSAFEAYFSEVA